MIRRHAAVQHHSCQRISNRLVAHSPGQLGSNCPAKLIKVSPAVSQNAPSRKRVPQQVFTPKAQHGLPFRHHVAQLSSKSINVHTAAFNPHIQALSDAYNRAIQKDRGVILRDLAKRQEVGSAKAELRKTIV